MSEKITYQGSHDQVSVVVGEGEIVFMKGAPVECPDGTFEKIVTQQIPMTEEEANAAGEGPRTKTIINENFVKEA